MCTVLWLVFCDGWASKIWCQKGMQIGRRKSQVAKSCCWLLSPRTSKKEGKIRGARKICEEVEIEYKNRTGKLIQLNHPTIIQHANGGKPIAEFNAEKCLLSKEEEEIILGFAEETANWGFPLSHQWLCEHTNSIIKAREGPSFGGVGQNWMERFVLHHSDWIKTIWSSSLEGAHAQSANPTNNAEWFNLLGETLRDVDPDSIWAVDETCQGTPSKSCFHHKVWQSCLCSRSDLYSDSLHPSTQTSSF